MNLKITKLLIGCSILFLTSFASFAESRDPCSLLTLEKIHSVVEKDAAPGKHFFQWQTCKWQAVDSEGPLVTVSFLFVHQFYNFKRSGIELIVPIKRLADDAFYLYHQPTFKVSKKDTFYLPTPPRLFFLTGEVGIEVTVYGMPDPQRAADIERKLADEIASAL